MKTIPREPVFIRHLPAALLFQGKIEKAKTIYLEWKDQAVIDGETGAETLFQELFLEDLQLWKKLILRIQRSNKPKPYLIVRKNNN